MSKEANDLVRKIVERLEKRGELNYAPSSVEHWNKSGAPIESTDTVIKIDPFPKPSPQNPRNVTFH